MATKQPKLTEGVTVRMEVELKRVFVELAAEESIARGASRSPQDVMRDWLAQHPAVKARLGKDTK
ncbi:hypothetical protein P9281_34790 [Caballeronia sp. LP003]|uniref:hypothetical protein n=1 Tax=Caballeronia sp. LP003 TaxID=3038551 RepID=UPI0028599343|nr:hypothetical protein [Caballeronia sp. LP003]MDR5791717.1 hypothetical protein [Caballeronia sp. LP003]